VTAPDAGYGGLGFRGVVLEWLSDEVTPPHTLPSVFRIAGGVTTAEAEACAVAERLVAGLDKAPLAFDLKEPAADTATVALLLEWMASRSLVVPDLPKEDFVGGDAPASTVSADKACSIELSPFNPGFWNDPAVRPYNNCYNYASNWRTDTFAQPGKGAGSQCQSMACGEVTRGALADGCHRRYDCFPDAEAPRYLMALVVAPGVDYHWYRVHSEGFWGHKPGSTPAKNTDNAGNVINSPETCARAPYTDFCGYLYGCKTQQRRIR